MEKMRKTSVYVVLAVAVLLVLFRFAAGSGFEKGTTSSTMVMEKAVLCEMTAGTVVEQTFCLESDRITELVVLGTTYGANVKDVLCFTFLDQYDQMIAQEELSTEGLPSGELWHVPVKDFPDGYRGDEVTIQVSSLSGEPGNAVSFFYGDSYGAGRYEIPVQFDSILRVGENVIQGQLCMSVIGENTYRFARYYWVFSAVVIAITAAFCAWVVKSVEKGRNNAVLRLISAGKRYQFLLKQLVSRDFKTKYKRSVLGVLWSFMNPLLTMTVMYIVFSTLFRSNIGNFPVYLLTGIVCWNYFSEVTSACLTSITGNVALITKVYVPKYIYPLSRAMSSTVNLTMSLIPLFLVVMLTGAPITLRMLLIPFPMVCLFMLSLGVGMFLASWMVMFRDTQFLWGVLNMLWMYLTPIFYDASIIPEKFMTLYKLNPLYHIVRLMRILLIDGVSPEPKAYLLCGIAAIVPLCLGVWVFKKTQDRFILYL